MDYRRPQRLLFQCIESIPDFIDVVVRLHLVNVDKASVEWPMLWRTNGFSQRWPCYEIDHDADKGAKRHEKETVSKETARFDITGPRGLAVCSVTRSGRSYAVCTGATILGVSR